MNKLEVKDKLKDNKLPERWAKIKLGEIIIENTKSRFKVENADNSGRYPFFTSGEAILSDSNYLVDYENVFLSTGGVANIKYYKGKANYSADTYCLKARITTKYLYYFLSKNLMKVDYKYFSGSGLKHLQKNDFKKEILILPSSYYEQQKIAEILENVDETIEKTDAIIEKYKRIKQGLMQDLLFRGITAFKFEKDKLSVAVKKVFDSEDHRFGREENLVSHLSSHLEDFFPEWDVDNEVEKNNERQRPDIIVHKRGTDKNLFAIEVKKNDNLNAIKEDIKKLEHVMLGDYQYEDAVFIGFNIENFREIFKLSDRINYILVSQNGEIKVKPRVRRFKDSSLGRIPEEWEVMDLGSVVKIYNGQSPSKYRLLSEGKFPFIKVNDLNFSRKYLNRAKLYFNVSPFELMPENILIFPKRGEAIFTKKVNIVIKKAFFDTNIMGLLPNDKLFIEYLFYVFFNIQLDLLTDITSVPQINNKHIIPLKILLPPLIEQQRISSIFSQVDVTIEEEQNYKQKLEQIKHGLMEDLLTGKVRVNRLFKEGVESV